MARTYRKSRLGKKYLDRDRKHRRLVEVVCIMGDVHTVRGIDYIIPEKENILQFGR